MPTTVTLRLRPARPWRPHTGQLHGMLCALFSHPASQHPHAKPFTAWPIRPDPADPHVHLQLRCAWRADDPLRFDHQAATRLRLGSVACAVVNMAESKTSFAELAGSAPAASATLTFHSPTYFAHNGADLVTPEPRLIVGSWRRQWNLALPDDSPLRIDDELWRQLHRAVRLAAFDLRTAEMDSGHSHPTAGFVGTAALQVDHTAPRQLRATFAALARFAAYCGTGAQTTHEFGATTSSLPAPPPNGAAPSPRWDPPHG